MPSVTFGLWFDLLEKIIEISIYTPNLIVKLPRIKGNRYYLSGFNLISNVVPIPGELDRI